MSTVNSVAGKSVSFALVRQCGAAYLCSQKLIDVQQALIANPNPLKNTTDNYRVLNPRKNQ
ncbi:MAG: hypothetical protein ACTHM5_12490 [Ginsengibacter sp.]